MNVRDSVTHVIKKRILEIFPSYRHDSNAPLIKKIKEYLSKDAKLGIYPMSIEPRVELHSDMKDNYHFGEITILEDGTSI